jgi:hypothetical protein
MLWINALCRIDGPIMKRLNENQKHWTCREHLALTGAKKSATF